MDFDELYHTHKNLVFNLALGYCQNKEDAEEITQEVFLTVFEKQSQFEGNSSLSTWIYRITVNKSLDYLKSKKRKKRSFLFKSLRLDDQNKSFEVPNFDHPGILLESKEAMRTIFAAINRLPDNQKTVILLLRLEEKTQAETAEIMGTSIKAVESLYQRAKKNLKQFLIDPKDGN